MKYLIIFNVIILLASGVFSEVNFSDVPEGHWAKDSVYDLVKKGVTRGYPDGTFRGDRSVSRYETAALLSKIIYLANLENGKYEKLIAELRTEAALIKYQRAKAAKETQFTAGFGSLFRTSATEPYGTKMSYRLNLDLKKTFDEQTSLKIGLDTVDAGFNTAVPRNLTTSLIDLEGNFQWAGMNFSLNFGPGLILHYDDLFPSENNTFYVRPKTALTTWSRVGRLDYSASYVARRVETSGRIGVHELNGRLKYKYGNFAVYLRPRYLFIIDGPWDIITETGLNCVHNPNWITYLVLGLRGLQSGTDGMYFKVMEKFIDPLKTGTNLVVRFDKVGSRYRRQDLDEPEQEYLNYFNRLILDGTADLGLKVDQKINDKLRINCLADLVTNADYEFGADFPQTYLLWQVGFSYAYFSGANFDLFYKSYHVPSQIAQFSEPVPEVSSLVGVAFNYSF
jgi:hypothetical protein